MDIVFIDTNFVRNINFKSFFGHGEHLKKYDRIVKYCIPSMVFDEIKIQKQRNVKEQIESIMKTYYADSHNLQEKNLEQHYQNKIDKLIKNAQSEFRHEVIELRYTDESFKSICSLALNNKPPFRKQSDHGFKDAYIYSTIKQYMANNPSENIFLITKDQLLKSAFENEEPPVILKDMQDYEQYNTKYFQDDYFVDTLRSYLENLASEDDVDWHTYCLKKLSKKDILKVTLNKDNNWVVEFQIFQQNQNLKVQVECDFQSREILNFSFASED